MDEARDATEEIERFFVTVLEAIAFLDDDDPDAAQAALAHEPAAILRKLGEILDRLSMICFSLIGPPPDHESEYIDPDTRMSVPTPVPTPAPRGSVVPIIETNDLDDYLLNDDEDREDDQDD